MDFRSVTPNKSSGSEKIPQPFTLVIFGASGDLTRRKLMPAIYHLYRQNLLPDSFKVVGFARREMTEEDFRDTMRESIKQHVAQDVFTASQWNDFARKIYYQQSDFNDTAGYLRLRVRLAALNHSSDDIGNCLLYLATQPAHFNTVIENLAQACLPRIDASSKHWLRIIIEKPFGRDMESAIALNNLLGKVFQEEQIFRIDHYLGKETVQNLLVFRFANSIFEPLWNNHHIDHVQITVSESIGVEGRGAFYEQVGTLRDIVQNHIMHLLSLVAMEPPYSLDAEVIRDEKVQVLKALRPIPWVCGENGVVRAQYTAGKIAGRQVPGYKEEPGVAPDSHTETFVAFKVMIDNWRFSGVPFYVRTGKRLPTRVTEIGIHFKSVPRILFNKANQMAPNWLAIRVQPHEGIALQFQTKAPGPSMQIEPGRMFFSFCDTFGKKLPDAYERLLLDAACGDATLFTRSDEVEAAWKFLDPVVRGCADWQEDLPTYSAGTWGPRQAEELIKADGRHWDIMRIPADKC